MKNWTKYLTVDHEIKLSSLILGVINQCFIVIALGCTTNKIHFEVKGIPKNAVVKIHLSERYVAQRCIWPISCSWSGFRIFNKHKGFWKSKFDYKESIDFTRIKNTAEFTFGRKSGGIGDYKVTDTEFYLQTDRGKFLFGRNWKNKQRRLIDVGRSISLKMHDPRYVSDDMGWKKIQKERLDETYEKVRVWTANNSSMEYFAWSQFLYKRISLRIQKNDTVKIKFRHWINEQKYYDKDRVKRDKATFFMIVTATKLKFMDLNNKKLQFVKSRVLNSVPQAEQFEISPIRSYSENTFSITKTGSTSGKYYGIFGACIPESEKCYFRTMSVY
jgi:hypothetical protein